MWLLHGRTAYVLVCAHDNLLARWGREREERVEKRVAQKSSESFLVILCRLTPHHLMHHTRFVILRGTCESCGAHLSSGECVGVQLNAPLAHFPSYLFSENTIFIVKISCILSRKRNSSTIRHTQLVRSFHSQRALSTMTGSWERRK